MKLCHAQLMLATAGAVLALAAAAGTTSANRLSISSQDFRVVWSGLEFQNNGAPGITCPVTIEGTFHSATIAKVAGSLIGFVTRAVAAPAANCTNGSFSVLQAQLPWHIRYREFTGTLPRIEQISISIINAAFLISSLIGCLYQSTTTRPMVAVLEPEAGAGLRMMLNELAGLPLARALNGAICPPTASPKANATMTRIGSTTKITVTLI